MARRWASVVQVRVPALEPWFFAYPQAVGRQTEPALLPAALAAQAPMGEGLRRGKSADDLSLTGRSAGSSACVPHSAAYTRGRCFDLVCAGA